MISTTQQTVSETSLPETPSENVSTHAAAPEHEPDMPQDMDAPNREPNATASLIAPPMEQESEKPTEHANNSDSVESLIRKLKGTRHNLLRTTTYYSGVKYLYGSLTKLPVLSGLAPTVESVAESLINITPLKPNEEEQTEHKSVKILDKKISDALLYADEILDAKKDETIEGIVSAKKVIHELGPVQNAVGVACNVGDGVGKAYDSANQTVGGVMHQVSHAVSNTYTGVTSMASETVTNVTNTAGSAVDHVSATTSNVVDSAKSTAGDTMGFVMEMVSCVTDSIGSTLGWAKSTAMLVVSTVVAYPLSMVQRVMKAGNEAVHSKEQ